VRGEGHCSLKGCDVDGVGGHLKKGEGVAGGAVEGVWDRGEKWQGVGRFIEVDVLWLVN